jgi:hypothetical protein
MVLSRTSLSQRGNHVTRRVGVKKKRDRIFI